jgi:hypothetical protein
LKGFFDVIQIFERAKANELEVVQKVPGIILRGRLAGPCHAGGVLTIPQEAKIIPIANYLELA